MFRLIIISCFFFCFFQGVSQTYQVSGTVEDQEHTALLGATVVVLSAEDSTMVSFGITNEEGKFLIYDVPSGQRILQVSYTGYADHSKALSLDGTDTNVDLGVIRMEESTAVLEEVSIKAEHIPMGFLGDTLNYNAAAFKTRPGASVEDLLKKLPGIEVARDGSIKAQGEDVKNVMVDGKEFFSGDATIATKNLEAEAVDKVQVFDKKSEEAEFTGVDDGQEEKTINLKLKEGYKNGGFGKASAAGGTESTRNAKLNYNRFSPALQASIIGNANNINRQAFSLNEYIDFMGGFQNVMANGGLGDFGLNGNSNQEGIRDQQSVGTNFNVDFSKKLKLNANYLFANSDLLLTESGTTKNFTDDQSFSTLDTSSTQTQTMNHRANTKLKYKPNPFNSFTLNTKFYTLSTQDSRSAFTQFLVDGDNRNNTVRMTDIDSETFNINTSLNYKKKYGKKGRNWISNLLYEQMTQEEDATLDNVFQAQNIDEVLDQVQFFTNHSRTISGNTKFTEPIGEKLYLEMSYAYRNDLQKPVRNYFDRVDSGLNLDEDISGDFRSNWTRHTGGLSLKRNRSKLKISASLDYAIARLQALDRGVQVNMEDDFYYVLPGASAKYKMKGNKKLDFFYDTQLNAPELTQMVTQINNLNPNFIILGNPDLSPEYIHTFRLNYSSYDAFNFSNHFANLMVSFSPNRIVNSRNLRSDLVTEILPVNARNFMMTNLYLSQNSPIRKLKIKYRISSNLTYSRYTTFFNGAENEVSNANANVDLRVENRNKETVDIAGGIRLDVSAFSNVFNSTFGDPFLNYSWYVDGFVNLGKGFNLNMTYDYRTFNNAFFENGQVLHLLGGKLSKSFLDNKFAVTLTGHDLLNQNLGINRSGNINTLSDIQSNALGRYVMVGLSYRIGMVKESGIDFGL